MQQLHLVIADEFLNYKIFSIFFFPQFKLVVNGSGNLTISGFKNDALFFFFFFFSPLSFL